MSNTQFKLGILGCGRWGINHVRTAHKLFGDDLLLVSDPAEAAADRVKSVSDKIPFCSKTDQLAARDDINSVIVATPAETHFETTKSLLMSGKNVLVEKPITLHPEQAHELIDLADKNSLKLMVGHILLYHPAIVRLKELLAQGKIGRLQYIYSNRLNFGTVRTEENILWSFAPHDISIVQHITGSMPLQVTARGASFLQSNLEDSTITYLVYPGNVHAHIFVSWLHPFKEHRLVVIGDKGMIVFEDSLPKEKLKFFPKGFNNSNGAIEKFDGDFEVIEHENEQPLAQEQLHFAESVVSGRAPLTDGRHALEVLEILQQAQRSMREHAV